MSTKRYVQLRAEGYQLSGCPDDFYRRLYVDSAGRNVFPLIAAHGAMWAAGYCNRGERLAQLLSWRCLGQPSRLAANIASMRRLMTKMKIVNRNVCAEAYALYE